MGPVKNDWTKRIKELEARAAAAETYLHHCRKALELLDNTDEELHAMKGMMIGIGPIDGCMNLVPVIDGELEYRRFQKK